jgi:peptidoglycan/LPS O-acetylase OafA/YrhL
MKYRAEIDGLRAVAVIPVVFFHAGIQAFQGGFVGVDVFFVISGYLITSILLKEQQQGVFSTLTFYERRARRILPAMFFMMLACIPMALYCMLPKDLEDFGKSLVAVPLFISNVLFWRSNGYFETATELKPLLHTWSLAVEEQFYIFFPLLLLALNRVRGKYLICVFAALAMGSLALAQWASVHKPQFAFYMLPTRGWELLIGSMAAVYNGMKNTEASAPGPKDQVLSLAGLFALLASYLAFDKNTPFPSIYTLLPALGTALILLFGRFGTFAGWLLSQKLLTGLGLISYSTYLWHQPILAFARQASMYGVEPTTMTVLAFASFPAGYLSWKFIENPFRGASRFSRRFIFASAIAGSLFFIALGAATVFFKGLPDRLAGDKLSEYVMPEIDNGWCFYSIDTMPELKVGSTGVSCTLSKGKGKTALLIGDSFAGQFEPFWKVLGSKHGMSITSATTNWCHPSLDEAFIGNQESPAKAQCLYNRKFLAAHAQEYDYVILGGMWADVYNKNQIQGVKDLLAYLSTHAKHVIIMPSPLLRDADVGQAYKKSILFSQPFDISSIGHSRDAIARTADQALSDEASRYKNMVFIERRHLFEAAEEEDRLNVQPPTSLDGNHISARASRLAAERFMLSNEQLKLQLGE